MNHTTGNGSAASSEGVWFSTGDLKLALSLHAAGFPFRNGSECTRLLRNGKESFTWHFHGTNSEGEEISPFLRAWEQAAPESLQRPSNMVCFFLAREIMYARTHVIQESHLVPRHTLMSRGDKRLMVTPRLSREEREKLAALAS